MLRPYSRGIEGDGGDLGFVGVADDEGDAGKRGEFFGSALGIAAGDDDAGGRIAGVDFADGIASLGIS
jgi:hypothetical protein